MDLEGTKGRCIECNKDLSVAEITAHLSSLPKDHGAPNGDLRGVACARCQAKLAGAMSRTIHMRDSRQSKV